MGNWTQLFMGWVQVLRVRNNSWSREVWASILGGAITRIMMCMGREVHEQDNRLKQVY
ncbi:hypothetical protein TSUD_135490 [Trifolium subterraneum]|uniref:Uncharacterized protein n=1 Tax=Trifolium subterraneum TaxID=3900 RepID=A0A2Z6PHJ8_TRISU|nr:hypothetical protein TSUD_135490 [Trifolium subterraneum]